MRKKYLSALLFGALLFASAGTFTSCKDYDDDINNLQEQINTVVSDLNSLKTTVEGLGGYVTDVKVEDGKLVVTANGSTVSYDLPAGADVADIKIENGHLYVDGTDKGEVGNKVTVNEDGELLIDGNASGLKVGSEVIIKDASNGIYTISIDGQTIQLPMASAAITSLEVTGGYQSSTSDAYYFTENYATTPINSGTTGIWWGQASSDLSDWTGTLGAVTKGQLLIGSISTLTVNVTPANFDLTKTELTLVDTKGNTAPAKLSASADYYDYQETTEDSRANSAQGKWTVSLTPTTTADKMSSAYTANNKNVLYALAADGIVLTPYNIVVDTRTNSEVSGNTTKPVISPDNLYIKDKNSGSTTNYGIGNVALGDNKITYKDAKIADIQVDIAAESIDDAELLGITLDKATNTLTVSDKAANNTSAKIKLNVTLLGTNGKKSDTNTFTITSFGKTSVNDKVTLETATYTVTPSTVNGTKDIILSLGDTFSGLTADQSTALSTVTWATDVNFFVKGSVANNSNDITSRIAYYATEADAKNQVNAININDNTSGSRVRNIKYARITVASYNSTATTGTHNLNLVLNTANGEIKKVVAPVNVTLPKFEDLFTKSGAWTDNIAKLAVNVSGQADLMTLFNDKTNSGATTIDFGTASTITPINNGTAATINGQTLTIASKAVTSAHTLNDLTANVKYRIAGNANFTVSSGDFTIDLVTKLNGGKFVYYNAKGEAVDMVINGQNGSLDGFVGANGNTPKHGLAFVYGGVDYVFKKQANIAGFTLGDVSNPTVVSCSFDDKAGNSAEATFDATTGKLTVSNLAKGTYETTLTVTYKQATTNVTSTNDVYESFTITLKVTE